MTGLKASTLFRAYKKSKGKADWLFSKFYSTKDFDYLNRGGHKLGQSYYIEDKLTEKLEAQEKELGELREAASKLAETWHDVYDEDVVITP